MNYIQLKKMIENKENNKAIFNVMKEYDTQFKIILNKYKWKYINTPLEAEDILSIFMFSIPNLIKKYSPEKGASFSTYIKNEFKFTIFKYTRSYGTRRYKVLNSYIEYKDGLYSIPGIIPYSELNFSTLTPFEFSVFLSIFEANKTIPQTAIEHKTSRYKIESALNRIKLKIKKQI
ncbi:MAG: sigma-70 family RNA polymerase sigma factor [Mycoplasma sp.]|nr:sigma-70 family RNA polymerase sigma factor [Mycoplasma sp.]